jgi:hypothetical protein
MMRKQKVGLILGVILVVLVVFVYALAKTKNGFNLFGGFGINFLHPKCSCSDTCPESCPAPVVTTSSAIKTCTDTDGGKNYNVKGTLVACSSSGLCMTGSDECYSKAILTEYYCDANTDGRNVAYTCPNGCSNGACKGASIITKPTSSCSWCGNQCVLSSTLVGKKCPDVMPPTGATCSMINGQCKITNGGINY